MAEFSIETPRLRLRDWRDTDVPAMAAMGADPAVMRYLGPLHDADDAWALVRGQRRNQAIFGHCFWAIERRGDARLIGLCGLNAAPAGTPLEGDLEIGWRLASDLWGQGYAAEAAEAALRWGATHRPDLRIAAMTVPANHRSWGLMERLGMVRAVEEDFDHPALAADDPLRRHVVYRLPMGKGVVAAH